MAASEIASDQKSEIKNHHSSIKHTASYYNDGDLLARGDG